MSAFVGIDVSKATLDVALHTPITTLHFQVPNTPDGFRCLADTLHTHRPLTRIGLEASGRYGEAVARYLAAQGYPVSYLNPKQVHAFSKVYLNYNKTDKQDARLIAHFCQWHLPDLWQPLQAIRVQLQQRVRRLTTLEKMRQQERNRLQSGLTDAFVLDQIRASIVYIQGQLEQTQAAIDQLMGQCASLQHQYRLLLSIPGIGAKTACLLLAELGDLSRFDSPRQLVAYIGITPQHFQSGTSVHKRASISKQGNARVRAALYMPAIVAKRWNKPCRLLAQRLDAAKKPGKVIVIAVMRKLIYQIFAILKSGQPFDPDFALSA